jgi:hypothetical protein
MLRAHLPKRDRTQAVLVQRGATSSVAKHGALRDHRPEQAGKESGAKPRQPDRLKTGLWREPALKDQDRRRARTLPASGASGLKLPASPRRALQLEQRMMASSASCPVRTTSAPQGLHFHCGPSGRVGASSRTGRLLAVGAGGASTGVAGGNFSFRIGRLGATDSGPAVAGSLGGDVADAGLGPGFVRMRDRRTIFGSRAMIHSSARQERSCKFFSGVQLHQNWSCENGISRIYPPFAAPGGISGRGCRQPVATAALRIRSGLTPSPPSLWHVD